jgi:hypothetical protein
VERMLKSRKSLGSKTEERKENQYPFYFWLCIASGCGHDSVLVVMCACIIPVSLPICRM